MGLSHKSITYKENLDRSQVTYYVVLGKTDLDLLSSESVSNYGMFS